MNLIELEEQIEKHKVIRAFKNGVYDAVVHGERSDEESHYYYKEGYDFGLTVFKDVLERWDIDELIFPNPNKKR